MHFFQCCAYIHIKNVFIILQGLFWVRMQSDAQPHIRGTEPCVCTPSLYVAFHLLEICTRHLVSPLASVLCLTPCSDNTHGICTQQMDFKPISLKSSLSFQKDADKICSICFFILHLTFVVFYIPWV